MEKSMPELLNCSFINIDKPVDKTSHDVDLIIRKILGVNCGHFGTLDPAVSGVLPIALGKAARLLQYLKSGKEYVGVMMLHDDVKKAELQSVIKKHFLGKIKQTPPKKSRVKRVERQREIYSFKIIEKKGKDVLFAVSCEA